MTETANGISVRVGGITAKCAAFGSGPPLLYLHGAFGYAEPPPFLRDLADSYSVYAPTHPGFEGDDGLDGIEDMLDLTLYHAELIEALGLERPHVVGHYNGAMTAAEMAVLNSGSLGKIVLAAPAGLWRDDNPGVDYNATPITETRRILFADPDSEIAHRHFPVPQDDEETGWQIIHRVQSLAAVGKFLWPIPDKGLERRARRIKSPALIAVGGEDKIVPPEYADILADIIPNSRSARFEGGGHMFPFELPAEFARTVREFLAD